MAIVMLENIQVNDNIAGNPLYNPIYSTEEANRLVKEGVPFRDAYKAVSSMIGKKVFEVTSLSEYVHEGSIGNLCNNEVGKLFRDRMKIFNSLQSGELIAAMLKKK